MKLNLLIILTGCFFLSGCAELLTQRTFYDEMERESDGLWVANRDFAVVPGDSGRAFLDRDEIMMRTPASYRTKEDYLVQKSIMRDVAEREQSLSDREYSEYRQVRNQLGGDSERLYYLNLSNSKEKQDYLISRGLARAESGFASTNSQQYSYDDLGGEIFLGMDKNSVSRALGRPERIDVAGNPMNQNERWAFYKNGKIRYVFFEAGVVQGWSME